MLYIMSVNVGQAERIDGAKASGITGIFKRPVEGRAVVERLGLAGDHIADTENHGGEDQAIYIYTRPDYAWWSAHLGRDLPPGTFGENLLLSDLESASLCVGDRLHIGDAAGDAAVTLEITAPRIPCVTLAARMGDPTFVKRFVGAERFGVYCRVLHAGTVGRGDSVTLQRRANWPIIGVNELARLFYAGLRHQDEATVRRVLAAPIAIRDRRDYDARLAEIIAGR
jgi:MOSC domain-containing protein YiiM